ncbi:MAG: hypothetical protein JSS27_16370 [Planctomycetes bacterium]|nr:hypothetical protein [Planctomycetota bacterium]
MTRGSKHMRRWTLSLVIALACSLVGALVANGDDKARDSKDGKAAETKQADVKAKNKNERSQKTDKKKLAKPLVAGFTEGREAAALAFVRMNHPELIDLLEPLKATNPHEYQKAIRDLFMTSEKLGEMQQRNPQRYELELQDWKLGSRVQVLAVRLALRENAPVESELRQLLVEQQETRRQLLLLERDRLSSRLADIDSQITHLNQDPGKQVDTRLAEMVNAARAVRTQSSDKKANDNHTDTTAEAKAEKSNKSKKND